MQVKLPRASMTGCWFSATGRLMQLDGQAGDKLDDATTNTGRTVRGNLEERVCAQVGKVGELAPEEG